MGRVRTKTVKKSSRQVIERYYSRMTLDFHTNKKVLEEVAIIPSKRLRNKIAGFSTHLMKRIQKGPVRGISLKLQEEERERRMDFVPDVSAIRTDQIEVDKETLDMLAALGMSEVPGIVQVDPVAVQAPLGFGRGGPGRRSLPLVAPLPTPSDSIKHSAIFVIERELKLLNFQLNNFANPSLGNKSSLLETGRPKGDFFEPLSVKQGKKHISTLVPHYLYLVLFVSSSGKFVCVPLRVRFAMAGVSQSMNISCDLPILKGDNYKVWKERVLLHLGWMDIDYAIRKDEPPAITETSEPDVVDLYEKWERSNRLSVMFIKTNISASIRGSVDQHDKLTRMKGVHEHIMRLRDIVAQLKTLEVTMSKSFLGMESLRKPMRSEQCIYSGSRMSSHVEAIGACVLVLNFSFNLLKKFEIIGCGQLVDGLYSIELKSDATYNSMHVSVGLKQCIVNEESSMLWHWRLGHISIERIKRLVKEGVLSTLDFANFETCVDCIKGKQTNKSKKGAKRSSNLLEIIHIDICCPDMDANSLRYFITFIEDYSRYMYLYLLHSKNEALDAFIVFKAEVEKQCGKQIKIVRSDRGGKYYGRYTEDGQAPGSLAKFLQEHGIVAQYTMFGSPDQNGVAE
ncbi:40S ribosomal protein S17-4 [Glycine soja]|uniref:40S ribosomal protein S17-4 n=2 Tax=Glycine soja TaxID=3848 RepID=A0A445LRM1_GLYSO|nr:40S ribosomal protein S17-4 [Glycine soja]